VFIRIEPPVLPPVLVPRHTEVPDKMPQLENYAMTVPEKTDFPTGNNEIFNLPETPSPATSVIVSYFSIS
jgi:MAD (mothers against decapentaplegic) family protein 2/3